MHKIGGKKLKTIWYRRFKTVTKNNINEKVINIMIYRGH